MTRKKKPDLDRLKQIIFSEKCDKKKKMWEAVLRKKLNEQNVVKKT